MLVQAQRAKEKEGSTQSQPWSASQSLRESADGSSGSRGLGQEQRPSVPPKPELLQDGAASKTEIQGVYCVLRFAMLSGPKGYAKPLLSTCIWTNHHFALSNRFNAGLCISRCEESRM